MKKLIPLLITLLLLTACNSSDIPEPVTSGEYKKLQTTIDVDVVHDGSSNAYTCTGSGAFMFDFYFPTNEVVNGGADAVAQESYFQLTGYECTDYSPGQALASCVVTLPESSYMSWPVTAEANLLFSPNTGAYNFGTWIVSDLSVERPSSSQLTLHPTTQCLGPPATTADPGTLSQIFSVFLEGSGGNLEGFSIPLGDDLVDIWSIDDIETEILMHLGNSANLVTANTVSNVWELP